jgi:cystathionine beta-synthase
MNKYGISQLPVTKSGNFVGSLNDNYLLAKLIEDNDAKNKGIESVMQPAFPMVDAQTPIDEISKLITKDNNAVLMKDLGGNTHIITKHDVIQAVARMGN